MSNLSLSPPAGAKSASGSRDIGFAIGIVAILAVLFLPIPPILIDTGLALSIALSQADGIIGRTLTSEDGDISGKVTAVRIVNGGALADLDSGKSVVLGPGVIIT